MSFNTSMVDKLHRIETTAVIKREVLHMEWSTDLHIDWGSAVCHTPTRRSAASPARARTKHHFEPYKRATTTLPTATTPNTEWKSAKVAKSEYGLTPRDLQILSGDDVLYRGRRGGMVRYNTQRLKELRDDKCRRTCSSQHQKARRMLVMNAEPPPVHPAPPPERGLFIPNAIDYCPGVGESLASFPLLGYDLQVQTEELLHADYVL